MEDILDEEVEVIEEEVTDGEETEVPLFMQEDEAEDAPDVMPVAAHLKAKQKLRGKIGEQDDEISQLKKQVEELKSTVAPVQTTEPLKRPRIADFDTDEEYETAMDTYEQQRGETQLLSFETKKTQAAQLDQQKQQVESAVESHYDRADELLKKHSIAPEVYKKADQAVRQAVASVLPGANADAIFESLINVVGEGSEKTMYHLGINKTALNNFRTMLVDDPTGLKASMYLGKLTAQIEGTTKRRSQAPAPAAQANGGNVNVNGSAEQRKYEKAHKSKNIQEAYNIKQAAKKVGIDVSKW